MIEKNDWRLTNQEAYLRGKQLLHKHWEQRSPSWDHDHCSFCWADFDKPTDIGYCTTDQYHWICEECFKDFKDMFQWEVVMEH